MADTGDIRAQIEEWLRFSRELGVEGLEVDLDLVGPSVQDSIAPSAKGDKAEVVEKFVPDRPIAPIQSAQTVPPAPRQSRLGLLESTRMSKISAESGSGAAQRPTPPLNVSKSQQAPAADTIIHMDKLDLTSTKNITDVRSAIGDCSRCPLCSDRTQIVHSTGNFEADLMFVGEAPGADEDAKGEPFVGRAGQLLTKIIESIGIAREQVFIGNINRCRPPGNRPPTLQEAASCKPFLLREIEIVKPRVIVVLGNTACQNLLDTKVGITKLRGNFQDYFGVKVMPTFHPAYLLRDPHKKREVWEDMKKVRDFLAEK